MGETRVDLEHLLEDLRDAYPYSVEETIPRPQGSLREARERLSLGTPARLDYSLTGTAF